MFNQQMPTQQFQQQMTNAFNQPMNLQSQMGMPGQMPNQMNVAPNQMFMNPNQSGSVQGNPMANSAMAMQAQMVSIRSCDDSHQYSG